MRLTKRSLRRQDAKRQRHGGPAPIDLRDRLLLAAWSRVDSERPSPKSLKARLTKVTGLVHHSIVDYLAVEDVAMRLVKHRRLSEDDADDVLDEIAAEEEAEEALDDDDDDLDDEEDPYDLCDVPEGYEEDDPDDDI